VAFSTVQNTDKTKNRRILGWLKTFGCPYLMLNTIILFVMSFSPLNAFDWHLAFKIPLVTELKLKNSE